MLDFFARPLRSALGFAEHAAARPVVGAEHEVAEASNAAHRVADSIEQHIQVVEGLAASIGPLTESVNQLTKTMTDLVILLAPMAAAEHEVEQVRRLFGLRRHKQTPTA
jgi:phage-related minor tail protein